MWLTRLAIRRPITVLMGLISLLVLGGISLGRLPLNERLLSPTLIDLNIFREQMEAHARIRIDSAAGQSAISALTL